MNNNELQSPYISHISWGHMEVDGVGEGKDFKLWPEVVGSGTGGKPVHTMCPEFWRVTRQWQSSNCAEPGDVAGAANMSGDDRSA